MTICSLDSRYNKETSSVEKIFNNQNLQKNRVKVECLWLIEFIKATNTPFKDDEIQKIKSIFIKFDDSDYQNILEIESRINHDIKACEYFVIEKLNQMQLQKFVPLVHFGLTSEDIDTSSYALLLKEANKEFLNQIKKLSDHLKVEAKKYASSPILSLTHGQPATPTTFGKEIVNFLVRIDKQINKLSEFQLETKIAGSTGNYQSLHHTYPNVDWELVSSDFSKNLNLQINHYNTQILPKENWLEQLFHTNSINLILLDMSKDFWGYIQRNVLSLKVNEQEVGSSTMPHKVNPINFENAEGNFEFANQIFQFFQTKLPVSRFQRDLSDKTSLRNLGLFYGYTTLAISSMIKGLSKVKLNQIHSQNELEENAEVLTELIQTMMRKYSIESSYEKLKELSRGKKMTLDILKDFINKLDLPNDVKQILISTKAQDYTGLATKLTLEYLSNK